MSFVRRLRPLVLLLLVVAPAGAQRSTAEDCTARITLLHVNDVYQFIPVERGARGGLARLSTLRRQIARESPNVIFLMGGDTISPSVESITYQGRQMIDAWNAIGLDYAVFGNHEFDFGPDVLRQRVVESQFKWLGANVVDRKTGKPFAGTSPYEIRNVGGIKVGIFGLVLPETQTTSRPGPDLEFRDACATARQVIPQMRAAGAQVVVALTHLSMNEDKELTRCVSQIDVILGGHEHTLLQSFAGRTPIFKLTADAREMGRIDVNVCLTSGRVESIDWHVIPVDSSVAEDPAFAAVNAKYATKLRELAVRVGATNVALDARSAANRTQETNVGNFITDAMRRETQADAALLNGGSIRADTVISPGELTRRDVLSILPFSGEVVLVEVNGEVLLRALESGLSRTGPGSEPGRFPQVSGLRFSFDARRPEGRRVSSVSLGGRPLDPSKLYRLAIPSFIHQGGDGYEAFKGARVLPTGAGRLIDSEVLERAIVAARGGIAPRTEGRIARLDREEPGRFTRE